MRGRPGTNDSVAFKFGTPTRDVYGSPLIYGPRAIPFIEQSDCSPGESGKVLHSCACVYMFTELTPSCIDCFLDFQYRARQETLCELTKVPD